MNRLGAAKHGQHLPPLKGGFSVARDSYQRGSIQFKNGRWTLRYWLKNWQTGGVSHPREVLEGAKDENHARRIADERMIVINAMNNNSSQREVFTFKQFVDGVWRTLMDHRDDELKPSTVYGYDSLLRVHILPKFGTMLLELITPSHLTDFFAEKRREKRALRYQRNMYNLLSGVFNAAVEHGYIKESPLKARLHRPKVARANRIKKPSLSASDLSRLIAEIDQRWRMLFVVAAVTSLRAGELLGLRWMDFDADAHTLDIQHAMWRGRLTKPKTYESERQILLPHLAVEAFRIHRMVSEFTAQKDYIFCREDGRPGDPDHLRRLVLYPAQERAGIELPSRSKGFHLFRHSGGRILYEATRDLKAVQAHLRHANISTTGDIYVVASDEVRAEATELIASQLACTLAVPQESDKIQ